MVTHQLSHYGNSSNIHNVYSVYRIVSFLMYLSYENASFSVFYDLIVTKFNGQPKKLM